ncbi:MAG: glycosyltransferase family 2 protein [Candidatus Tectomicrobia bacterium]|nr:glycosyltransferase family 2 protein [Candidatus Tectomicrobia bacterium]
MRPQWSLEKQPDPLNFGQARLVPRWRLDLAVWRRRRRAARVLAAGRGYCDFEPGLVSLVVLSCKRLPALLRLCDSLRRFFDEIEDYPKVEKILVDNGSGDELLAAARQARCFDQIIAHPVNLGMAVALNDAYPKCRGEYILFVEDDFVLDHPRPFLRTCLEVFAEHPEIGIIRLKNQNNWWKPYRIIGPLRATASGAEFWTWLPTRGGELNVWAAGSVLFRKVSFFSVGPLPVGPNLSRDQQQHQGFLYECVYGRRYSKRWLAAKIKDCYPFFQPNDNPDSPGWGEVANAGRG